MADKNINSNNDPAKHSLRISLLYVLFGSIWIIISDFINSSWQNDHYIEYFIEAGKGLLFVFVTAILLYVTLKRYFTLLTEKHREIIVSEEKYRSLAENMEFSVIRHDLNCRYIYINKAAWVMLKELLKISKSSDIIGLTPEEAYKDEDVAKKVRNGNDYVIESGKILTQKLHYGNKYISYSKIPEFDESGMIISVMTIIIDETEIMENMIKLEETEKFNSHLVNSSHVVVYIYDLINQNQVYANKALKRILGYSADEIRSSSVNILTELMHPEDRQKMIEYVQNTVMKLKDGEVSEFEYRMRNKNGNYCWFKSHDCIFKRDENGFPLQILGSAIDITDLKSTQEELERKTDYLNAVIEASPISIFDLDSKGRIKSIWNKASEKMFGWKKDEVIGKILPIVPEEKMHEFRENITLNLSKKTINGKEYLRKRKDSSNIDIRVYSRPVTGSSGEVESILAYNEDISLEKKFEETTRENEKFLKLLYEASLKASNSLNNRDLYKECFTYIDDILDVTSIMVSLVTDDGKYIKYDAVRVAGEDVDVNNIPLMKLEQGGKGPLTRTIIEGSARVIEDLEESAKSSNNKFFIDTKGMMQDLNSDVENVSRSAIMIPLKYAEKVIGVLQVQNISSGVYSDKDVLKLEPFAFIFASAINRSKLYNKLQNELAEKAAAFDQVRKFSKGIEQSPNSIVITNANSVIEYVNPYFTELTGYTLEEAVGKNPSILQSGHTSKEIYIEMWEKLLKNEIWHGEFLNKKKNGDLYWESASIGPILDKSGNTTHYIAIKQDITDQKKRDKEQKDSLDEKEVMLKEIHHRVKNNLQVISSLLNMQVEQYEHPEAIEAINTSRNRVKAMALVHESLYRSRNIGKTDFREYLMMLAKNIYSSYGISLDKIELNVESSGAEFGLDTIIPLGLILNEAISNSLKHAFPPEEKGKINISLKPVYSEHNINTIEYYVLTIKDNGRGLPEKFDHQNTGSLGMSLLTSLASQLDGEALIRSNGGTEIIIKFKELTYKKRI